MTDRPVAHLRMGARPGAFTDCLDTWQNPNEYEHGVDVGQIRIQLTMSVEDRVRHMVEVANAFMKIRATVRFADGPLNR